MSDLTAIAVVFVEFFPGVVLAFAVDEDGAVAATLEGLAAGAVSSVEVSSVIVGFLPTEDGGDFGATSRRRSLLVVEASC